MKGWKTKLGMAGVMATAFGAAVVAALAGDWNTVVVTLMAAFASLQGTGIAHKIEKAATT